MAHGRCVWTIIALIADDSSPETFALANTDEKNKNYIEKRERDGRQTFPQNAQVYFECCVTSIFLTVFRNEAP